MRYAVLGDIHANYDALRSVLDELQKESVDRYLCVGDLVGYAAEPSQCIAAVRELDCAVVAGNHDQAVTGDPCVDYFNPDARAAALWAREQLSTDEKEYLAGLDMVIEEEAFTLVHATLPSPESFAYIQTEEDVSRCFQALNSPICFVGHSHVPATFFDTDPVEVGTQPQLTVKPDERVIINVGSVGQPRDENADAAFLLFDSDTGALELRRVPYDIAKAAQKIMDAGLPPMNAMRLHFGR